jgi:hypothetical protein
MFTIDVKPDISEANQPLSYLVEKCIIDEKENSLDAYLINLEAFNHIKENLATHNRIKHMVKLDFAETLYNDKLLVTFKGNIRHSLIFLIDFGTISQEAYDEAILKLNNASYKLPIKKIDTTSNIAKLDKIEELKQQPSSSVQTGTQANINSSPRLFSHSKGESTTRPAIVFCPPTCNI